MSQIPKTLRSCWPSNRNQQGQLTHPSPSSRSHRNWYAMQKLVKEKSKRIFAEQVGPSVQQAWEEALSDIIFVGFGKENTGFKIASCYYIVGVITEIESKDSFDDMIKRNLEPWTQSSSFVDDFAQRFLNSPRFVQPVAKFICKQLMDRRPHYQIKEENDRKCLEIAVISVTFVDNAGQWQRRKAWDVPPC